jgi:hypothetical protein
MAYRSVKEAFLLSVAPKPSDDKDDTDPTLLQELKGHPGFGC